MLSSIFQCDKCKREWKQTKEGWPVQPVTILLSFNFNEFHAATTQYGFHGVQQAWCRECVMKHGVAQPISAEEKTPMNIGLTPEQNLVNALRELGFVQHHDLPAYAQ